MDPLLPTGTADPQLQPLSYPYDPSQPPSYDPNYHYYYYHHHQQPQLQPPYNPQPYLDPSSQYPHYPHDYSAAYAQVPLPSAVPAPQPLPPGVPAAAPDPAANAYLPHPDPSHIEQQPGINPAAAAAIKALSELTQFAERMDAEERARVGVQWHDRSREMVAAYGAHDYGLPQVAGGLAPAGIHVEGGRKQKGRGQQGRGSLRGGRSGRGMSNLNTNGLDGKSPSTKGRGRGAHAGRGRGRHAGPGNEQLSAQASVQPQRPIVVAWCDICRVDCNSLEILEQHKNGKRHKKTIQKLEEMQVRLKLLAEQESKANEEKLNETNSQTNVVESQQKSSEQPEIVTLQQAEVVNVQDAIINYASTELEHTDKDNAENTGGASIELSSEMQPSRAPTVPMRGGRGRSRPSRGGLWRLGRGGKRLRYLETGSTTGPLEFGSPTRPPKRPREAPPFCNICSVTCDTQAVFERHLAGKKHLSKVKRLAGQAAFVHPNQNPGAQNLNISVGIHPNDASGTPPQANNSINTNAGQVTTGTEPQGNIKSEADPPGMAAVTHSQEHIAA